MIQVNLIPDLKAEFLKAQRTKRFVIGIAFLVSAVFLALVILMFVYVNVWQSTQTNNNKAKINDLLLEYQKNEDLDKIVSVQNQLSVLPELHNQKPLVSRLVTYLAVITPKGPEYRSVNLNFDAFSVELVGTAESPVQVNELANTVKNAVYTVAEDKETSIPAFSNVILDTITSDEDGVNFSMRFTFDEQIFSNHDEIEMIIPEIDSTNSEVNRPKVNSQGRTTDLFNDQEEEQ